MKYDRQQQEQILRRYVPRGRLATMAFLNRYGHQIDEAAIVRAMGEGFELYGDKVFHRSAGELWRDTIEELADAAVYRGVRLWSDDGRPLL